MNADPTTGRAATRAGLLVLTAVAAAAPAAFWTNGADSFESLKSLLLLAAGCALGLIALLCPGRVPRDPLSLAAYAAAACAVATAASIDPVRSLVGTYGSHNGLLTALALLAVFVAARVSADSPARVRRLMQAIAVGAALAAGYGLVQVAGADPVAWGERSNVGRWVRPTGTMGHPVHLGALMALALPPLLWLGGRQRVFLVVAAGCAAVMVLALARGAWIAAAAGLVVVALLRGRVAGLALVGLALAAGAALIPTVRERLAGLLVSPARLEGWRACWALFLERPLVGHGPDTLGLVFGTQLTPAYWEHEWGMVLTRAHNEPLDVLVSQGVLGGVAWLALVVALVHAVGRAWRTDRDLTAALAGALTAGGVALLTGFSTVGVAVPLAACAGVLGRLAAGPLGEDAEPAIRWRWPSWRASAAVGLASVALWAAVLRPGRAWDLCRWARAEPTPAALTWAEQAAALCPEREDVWAEVAAIAERLADGAATPRDRVRLLRRSVEAAERAVNGAPMSFDARASLGRIKLTLAKAGGGTLGDALRSLHGAMRLSPRHAVTLVEAARGCLDLGDLDRAEWFLDRAEGTGMRHGSIVAERAAVRLAQGRPEDAVTLLESAFRTPWRGDADGAARALELAGLALLEVRNPEAALSRAERLENYRPGSPIGAWVRARALEALGRRADAAEAYREFLRRAPESPPGLAGLARVSR